MQNSTNINNNNNKNMIDYDLFDVAIGGDLQREMSKWDQNACVATLCCFHCNFRNKLQLIEMLAMENELPRFFVSCVERCDFLIFRKFAWL